MQQLEDYSVWGWERFFDEMGHFLATADREFYNASPAYAQFVAERLEVCIDVLSTLCREIKGQLDTDTFYRTLEDVKSNCMLLWNIWSGHLDELEAGEAQGYSAPSVRPGGRSGRGRPQLLITQEQLEYLCSLNFSWSEVSRILGVSRMTVYRRRRDLGIVDSLQTSRQITDTDLRAYLQQLRRDMPHIGETLVIGRLRSLGYSVTRQRVRDAIHETDPLNTALRWRGILTARRPYSVPSPNSLWHIGEA